MKAGELVVTTLSVVGVVILLGLGLAVLAMAWPLILVAGAGAGWLVWLEDEGMVARWQVAGLFVLTVVLGALATVLWLEAIGVRS